MSAQVNEVDPRARQDNAAGETAGPRAGIFVLIAVFFLSLLPYAVTGVLLHPDENQYVDAGVFMCQSNDWLMPSNPNDEPPDNLKPILTYWVIAVCYKVFGVSWAAARLPYLLAGVATIWLTYRMAMMLTGSRAAAGLACALLLCNPMFWLSAIRCMPDIWLCLFLVMSAYGFLGLLTLEVPTSRHALLAYLGAGLAILSKGVPAVVFLGFVFLFSCCNPWLRGGWRRLIHLPSMLLGAVVATAWVVVVYFVQGTDDLKYLWLDQIGLRFHGNTGLLVYRFPLALGAVALGFLPLYWPMLKMGSRWRAMLPASRPETIACWFIALWVGLFVLAISGTISTAAMYIRYLLPVFPLLGVLFGIVLVKIDGEILKLCFRRLFVLALVVLSLAGVGLAVVSAQLELSGIEILASLALLAIFVVVALVGLRGSWLASIQAIAVVMMLAMPAAYFIVNKIADLKQEGEIAQDLQSGHYLDRNPVAAHVGNKLLSTRLRLDLGTRVTLFQWTDMPVEPIDSLGVHDALPPVLILPTPVAVQLPAERYTVHPAGSTFVAPQKDEVLAAISQGRLKDCLLQHRLAYSIAVRNDGL